MTLRQLTAAATALGASLLLVTATGAHAQDPAAPGQGKRQGRGNRQQPPILRALASLDLTAEQKAKIDPLVEKYRADVRALSPEERRTKQRDLTQTLVKDVNAVLTPEQQAKLKMEMARANGPFAAVVRQLNLTDEQRPKILPIVNDANEQIAKMDADTSLKGRDKREKRQSIINDAVAKMKPILTAEQNTKLDEAVAKMAQRGGKNKAGAGNGANQ